MKTMAKRKNEVDIQLLYFVPYICSNLKSSNLINNSPSPSDSVECVLREWADLYMVNQSPFEITRYCNYNKKVRIVVSVSALVSFF